MMFNKSFKFSYIVLFNFIILLLVANSCDKNTDEPENGLLINEFLAINDDVVADEFEEFDDWMEIFNSSHDSINIGGMFISDRLDDTNPYMIPDSSPDLTIIPPQGYMILWCDREIEQGPLHIDIKLSGSGESIVLIDYDGDTVIDKFSFGPQTANVSMGRVGDDWVYFETPTPGQPN